jgi:hypothetical protein
MSIKGSFKGNQSQAIASYQAGFIPFSVLSQTLVQSLSAFTSALALTMEVFLTWAITGLLSIKFGINAI